MKFKCNGVVYDNIKRENDVLIKKTTLSKRSWEYIQSQNLSFVLNPLEIKDAEIILPYLADYQNLCEIKRKFDEKTIYLMLIRQLKYIFILHKNGIIHGDIFSLNIMLNEVLNFKLIDFDYSIVNKEIPEENIYIDDGLSDDEIIRLTKFNDVKDTLITYLYYLINNRFSDEIVDYVDIDKTNLPTSLKEKIVNFFSNNDIPDDYFMPDFVRVLKKFN